MQLMYVFAYSSSCNLVECGLYKPIKVSVIPTKCLVWLCFQLSVFNLLVYWKF